MLNPVYKPASLRSVGVAPYRHDVVDMALDVSCGGAAHAHRFQLTLADAERTALALLDAVAVQRHLRSIEDQFPRLVGQADLDAHPLDQTTARAG